MPRQTDFAVIGRGLMGTACARHLAEAGHSVTMIGPDEPQEPKAHSGPFGSFHDAGRITRRIAHDAVWAQLSTRALARYSDLEARSGMTFYAPRGGMMAGPAAGPGADFTRAFLNTSAEMGLPHEVLEGASLAERMPMFHLGDGAQAALDPAGGTIDPRVMRRAEEDLAIAARATCLPTHVSGLDGTRITLADGSALSVGHVILATGAYAGPAPLRHPRPKLSVYKRTVLFAKVSEAEATRLAEMPSLIFMPEPATHDLYLLPPIRYPDGHLYLKIGGELQSPEARSAADLANWFQSDGSPEAGVTLLRQLQTVMPDLTITSSHTGACAVSFTATGYPYIGRIDANTTLLTGGNGAGAKCADELGRLGAAAALGRDLTQEDYATSFDPVFE